MDSKKLVYLKKKLKPNNVKSKNNILKPYKLIKQVIKPDI